ncbi:hypothetical protein GCM10009733_031240 [Nonomuraea maheshkhaliensis]|uniref:Uncharacterized protein n=2 Tax=Nonomuraea maheshkhaliensis TaxID=419590 RepID=A0ABP4R1D8_9ACTN
MAQRMSAQEAVLSLMSLAFIEIRYLARMRQVHRSVDEDFPADFIEQIRLIADLCHNLPGDFSARGKRERERRATASLKFFLRRPESHHSRWVKEHLTELGYDYSHLLEPQSE